MGFLKTIGLSSGTKSRPTSAGDPVRVASIVRADLEENEGSSAVSTACYSTERGEPGGPRNSGDADAKRRRIAELRSRYKKLADDACERLLEVVECRDSDWAVWENKGKLLIEKNSKGLSGGICGRGSFTWTPPEDAVYDFDHAVDFLWDDKTKPLYDEFTQEMLVLIDLGDDYHILNQVFHGRFGICGRDFVLAIHKKRYDTKTHERLVIGVVSVPKEDESIIDECIIDDEVMKKHISAKERLVRGTAYIAGFCLSRDKATGEFCVSYVHDADVRTQGVPHWIVNRVKLDQLRIVKEIPRLLLQTSKIE